MKGPDSSLAHYTHRLLGQIVTDGNGRRGVLRAIAPDLSTSKKPLAFTTPKDGSRSEAETTKPVAWLAPEKGGAEWTAPVGSIHQA